MRVGSATCPEFVLVRELRESVRNSRQFPDFSIIAGKKPWGSPMQGLSPLRAKQPSLTPQGFQNTAQGRGSTLGRETASSGLYPERVGPGQPSLVEPLRGREGMGWLRFPGCAAATLIGTKLRSS